MRAALRSLDHPGGHIAVCVFLIVLGAALAKLQIPKAEDVIVFALGALGRSMVGEKQEGES